MDTICLPHLPHHPLHLLLVQHVQNAPFLRQQLLQANPDFEYAFLDASVLLSRNHVVAACFRALTDLMTHRLKTRNVHSEIVFALNPNNNIAESFRRFGIQDSSHHIVAIKVGGDRAQVEEHLREHLKGTYATFSDETLTTIHDPARIRKVYRLEAPKDDQAGRSLATQSEAAILASMALKGS